MLSSKPASFSVSCGQQRRVGAVDGVGGCLGEDCDGVLVAVLAPERNLGERDCQPDLIVAGRRERTEISENLSGLGRLAGPAERRRERGAGRDRARGLEAGSGEADRELGVTLGDGPFLRARSRDRAGQDVLQAVRDLLTGVPEHDLGHLAERHRVDLDVAVQSPQGEVDAVARAERPGSLERIREEPAGGLSP